MRNKPYHKNDMAGFAGKILIPTIIIFLIVGVVYWGSDESNQTSDNPLAKGVAKFYAEVRRSIKPGSEKLDDYTIELPATTTSVDNQLNALGRTSQGVSASFEGNYQKRTFRQNDTMKNALQSYAKAEGMDVIWDLKYDYIVKHHFAEVTNLKELVDKVARSVETDYDGTVQAFFCPRQRAYVITANASSFIQSTCATTKSTKRLMLEKAREREYRRNNNFERD